MEQAGKEILIVSPYISKGRVTQMKRLFWPAMTKGAGVIIFTRPPESFAEASRQKLVTMLEELRSIGVKVILKERIHQKFAVIDHRTVWYGSINPLSYGKSEENMMRFENGEIAEELLMDLEKDASRLFSAAVPPLNRQAGERFIRVLLEIPREMRTVLLRLVVRPPTALSIILLIPLRLPLNFRAAEFGSFEPAPENQHGGGRAEHQ